jgi:hypothetical protein
MKAAIRMALPLLVGAYACFAQTGSPLDRLAFLSGEWKFDGTSELGTGEGLTSFAAEIDKRIIVRRSWTKYASGGSAGPRREDLLIIYAEGTDLRAIYFDGEGHVIRYNVTVPSASTAVFESDASQPGPRFRLTHAVDGARMATKFEIAPPGQPAFKTYVSGTLTKR